MFGSIAVTALYPLSLGLGSFDPYVSGWDFSGLFPAMAVITIVYLWQQNRLGYLLLAAVVAYDLHCLESLNFWDYIIDPIYWLLSLVLLARVAMALNDVAAAEKHTLEISRIMDHASVPPLMF